MESNIFLKVRQACNLMHKHAISPANCVCIYHYSLRALLATYCNMHLTTVIKCFVDGGLQHVGIIIPSISLY